MRPSDKEIQFHVANAAIGTSTVRGKGNTGVAIAARTYLARLSLGQFTVSDEFKFSAALDSRTDDLAASLPEEARHWGLARKCINVFLRDVFYNRLICGPLMCCESWLEIPLDSIVAKYLTNADSTLPKWPGVKLVTSGLNRQYQISATGLAEARGYPRVYLDSVLWPNGRGQVPGSRGVSALIPSSHGGDPRLFKS